jgi:hypothetical protein
MQWRQIDADGRPAPWGRSCLVSLVPGTLFVTAVVLLLALLLVKLLWAWTVPDLFPGAVKGGLIAETISWYAAFKLAIFIAVLAGVAREGRGR